MQRKAFHRLRHFEFWPFWVFYAPFLLQWFVYSLRGFSFLYFSRTNPALRFGGLLHYSKFRIFEKIAPEYRPFTRFYSEKPSDPHFYQKDFPYPFIYKPDEGERGINVELVRNEAEWLPIYEKIDGAFMLQKYIGEGLEFGVLYFRYPSGKDGISSITAKEFLYIEGNGNSSLKELVQKELRAEKRIEHLRNRFSNQWNEILPKGQKLLLEPIGNHNRGTAFLDANHLNNAQLVKVFRNIIAPIDGFYYGRFDLKVPSIADLYAGKNIQIFELNGVNSEATHIYQPGNSLWNAYKDVYHNLKIVFEISQENRRNGVKATSLREFLPHLIQQIFGKK